MVSTATILALGLPAQASFVDFAGNIAPSTTLGGNLTDIVALAGGIASTPSLAGAANTIFGLGGSVAPSVSLSGNVTTGAMTTSFHPSALMVGV